MDSVLSIRELNQKLRQVLDARFAFIWVKGEITNCARPSSGHVYFSLKDGDDLLNCVWFRNSQKSQPFDPVTGEVWEDGPRESIGRTIADGQEIICAGRLALYGPRGQYQLVVELAQESGMGQLHAEFEALKKKLSHEGLFDTQHKNPLPAKIHNVALITAPSGAVIQDFLRISKNRGIGGDIRIYPSLVQGNGAAPMLIEALHKAQHDVFPLNRKPADVIILIRGGGSIQDLWAFNNEDLARAIHTCPIPIITGIGHEPDHSIADYVADISVATPSHAAQIIWTERHNLMQFVDDIEYSLTNSIHMILKHKEQLLTHYNHNIRLLSPLNNLETQYARTKQLAKRMHNAMHRIFEFSHIKTEHLTHRIQHLQPNFTQKRQELVQYTKSLSQYFQHSCHNANTTLDHNTARLIQNMNTFYTHLENQLEKEALRLEMYNPLRPLEHGYVLVTDKKAVIRSVHDIHPDERLRLTFHDGHVDAIAKNIQPTIIPQ